MSFHQDMVAACQGGGACAVAMVLTAEGSTPRKAGVKAVIGADGTLRGTIGGGAVEAEAQRRAREAIQDRRPILFTFSLLGAAVAEGSPICGGQMRVLVCPVTADHLAAYGAAEAAQQRRERGVLLTEMEGLEDAGPGQAAPAVRVRFLPESLLPAPSPGSSRREEAQASETSSAAAGGSQSLLTSAATGGEAAFPGAEKIRAVLDREEPELLRSARMAGGLAREVLVEPVLLQPILLIVGGGHVGQAVAAQAALVGFEIVVLDDRAEFTQPALFPGGTQCRCQDIAEGVGGFPITSDTYVVIVTRGHQHDAAALLAALPRPAAYLGMIGSRRKVGLLRQALLESGQATEADLERVYAPIGLEIGAVTVPEIATSIVAQLIAVRRTGRAQRIVGKPHAP